MHAVSGERPGDTHTGPGQGVGRDTAAAHQRLARELCRLRAASSKSLKELEPELHVSDSSLSRYLSGRAVPPWTVVARLARLVGREPGGSCDGFPTLEAAGQTPVQGVTPARPQGDDHEPTVTLVTGAVDGRPSIWAEITGAQAGDRVWIDWSDTEGVSHTRCGPFGVTPPDGVSRAAEVVAGRWFRACGDTPRAVAGSPRNACTDWDPVVSRRSPPG
ncbi:helix-turn-helix domain-containing protein [Kineosporia sp. J2-2]|uniref:Helix-turn-helix domain-containing protein n=1 Tax=Kineosporia corallincola TaxID=2835133 RepID=A0ABS5TNL6_9ACTN|nr:helix-turn-helix transcriptional regulator [Kineosporia corallincola]MBT0771643.1 helix-turn-helix domain-containing protein [Kineosporia corallincola]